MFASRLPQPCGGPGYHRRRHMSTVEQTERGPDDGRPVARRNLGAIVWGQAVSLFGDYVAIFALPYFMVALTGEALDLTLVWWFENLPMLLFGLAAGVYLDRRARLRLTLITVDLVRAAMFGLLAVAAASGVAGKPMIFLVAFAAGSMAVLFDSGLQALMPSALREEQLITANSRIELARTIMGSLGPLVAGLAVAVSAGFAIAFAVNGVTFLASAVFLGAVKPKARVQPTEREPFWASFSSGVRYLFSEPHLRWATLGASATNLVFAPLAATIVLFVASVILGLDVGAGGDELTESGGQIGLFFALMALIGAVGVAVAPAVARRLPLGTMYVLGLALFGIGFVLVSRSTSMLAVIPAGIGLSGVTWVNIALVTLRQRLTPPELLGRVITASRWIAWLPFLFVPVAGLLADALGLRTLYLQSAAALLVVALALTATKLYRDPVMADPGETPSHPVG